MSQHSTENPVEAEDAENVLEIPTRAHHNAFSEIMRAKPKPSPKEFKSKPVLQKQSKRNSRLAGLLPYIAVPESNPLSRVVYWNANYVVINDLYPKSTIHLLLLPRDMSKTHLNPREAFRDAQFLASVRDEAGKAAELAAKELGRTLGQYSNTERARIAAMKADNPPHPLPPGRDWSREIKVGIHAHPSMDHIHIHILSRDMFSPLVKHRKHYNSFNTPFFIPLDDFPLAEDDPRWDTRFQNANISGEDFKCWRCGKKFGNKFTALKRHLEEEYHDWRAE